MMTEDVIQTLTPGFQEHIFVSTGKQFKWASLFSETIWDLGTMSPVSGKLMAVWKQKPDRAGGIGEKRGRERKRRRKKKGEEAEDAPKKMISKGEPIIIRLCQAIQSSWFLSFSTLHTKGQLVYCIFWVIWNLSSKSLGLRLQGRLFKWGWKISPISITWHEWSGGGEEKRYRHFNSS